MGSDSRTWVPGDQDTPIDALARAVAATPQAPMLDFAGDRFTYGDVDQLTNRLAHSLLDLGVGSGETVVTILDNNIDAVVAWIAINKIRAVSVPLNTALRGEFLRHQVDDAGASLVICEAEYLERLVAIADRLPDVRRILVRGELGEIPASDLPIDGFDAHRGSDGSPIDGAPAPGELALLIYTSGTTGPSKGCMISHNYMCNLARLKLRGAPAVAADVVFTPLPLFHMNAVVSGIVSSMLVGASVSFATRFSVSSFWPEIERSGATVVSILGSMAILLGQAPDDAAMQRMFGQVHTVRGNPFTQELKDVWRTRFGVRHVGSNDYGLTEAAVVTSLAAGEHEFAPPGSSGRRNPDYEVLIVDDNDQEVPPGTPGEVIIRPLKPDVMFQGYWRRPEDTLSIMRNLWLHSGDIGKFDEDGWFYFVDRKKDYLRRRGENISSFEMESTFAMHPDIEEVAVHAVLSPVGEDDVKVTAVLYEGSSLTEEMLCKWAVDQVPYYAVPRFIEFRDALPKNAQGRVLKYQLREEGKTERTWDLEDSDIVVTRR